MNKANRLRNKNHFAAVYRTGMSVANRQLVLYYCKTEEHDTIRVGISVSRKLGGAVVRNRLRRRLKEIVRRKLDQLIPGYDLVFIVRHEALKMDYANLEKSVGHILKKADLMLKKE